jgi:cyclophilin family peptidyl-prolyl cis-trans isomerase
MGLARDSVPHCRTIATQAITRALNASGDNAPPPALRGELAAAFDEIKRARRSDLVSGGPLAQVAAAKAIATWGDSADIGALRVTATRMQSSAPAVALAATNAADAIARRSAQGGGRQGQGRGQGRPPANLTGRTITHYRAITERWVVPDYEGKPRPVATWSTTRGEIEIELYAGDAPLATDDFVRTMEAGFILGTQFTRVVPDFVDQQEGIRPGNVLRDEVNRHRIIRANISWASAGLDTGNPGYTLNHTPQPHNEGGFTTLGRVVRGMDVVDRIELGDRITCGQCPVRLSGR